jgi:hypothetical protein
MVCHEIVDSGASWREYFLRSTPPIPNGPNPGIAGAKGETYGASSENLKTTKSIRMKKE